MVFSLGCFLLYEGVRAYPSKLIFVCGRRLQLVCHHCICGSGFKETCISCCLEKKFGIKISVLLSIPINLNKQMIADTQIPKAEVVINTNRFLRYN